MSQVGVEITEPLLQTRRVGVPVQLILECRSCLHGRVPVCKLIWRTQRPQAGTESRPLSRRQIANRLPRCDEHRTQDDIRIRDGIHCAPAAHQRKWNGVDASHERRIVGVDAISAELLPHGRCRPSAPRTWQNAADPPPPRENPCHLCHEQPLLFTSPPTAYPAPQPPPEAYCV